MKIKIKPVLKTSGVHYSGHNKSLTGLHTHYIADKYAMWHLYSNAHVGLIYFLSLITADLPMGLKQIHSIRIIYQVIVSLTLSQQIFIFTNIQQMTQSNQLHYMY